MATEEKPEIVKLSEASLISAIKEWLAWIAVENRKLGPEEERLYRAVTNWIKTKRITGSFKIDKL